MARANPPETLRKLVPGSVGGDRVVQPGVHMTPTANAVRIAAVGESPCIPETGTFAESFAKADGLGWGPDLAWMRVYPYASYYDPVATLGGTAVVDVGAACAGGGLFTDASYGQVEASLTPDQIVEATFVDYTPTWTGGGEYANRMDLLARLFWESGFVNYYNAGVLGAGDPAGTTYLIQKTQLGGGSTIATTGAIPAATLDPGDVLRFEVAGNSLVFKVNGSTILSTTDEDMNPDCSSAGLGLAVPCVDVTAPFQGPFGGAGGWATIQADDFSVVAS